MQKLLMCLSGEDFYNPNVPGTCGGENDVKRRRSTVNIRLTKCAQFHKKSWLCIK